MRLIDYDSEVNLDIMQEFIREHIVAEVTDLMEEVLANEASYDDFFSMFDNVRVYICPFCGQLMTEYRDPEMLTYECPDCGEFDGSDERIKVDMIVPKQYYIVSDTLADQLREMGEPIRERYFGSIWGRTIEDIPLNEDDSLREIGNKMGIFAY